MREKLAYLDEQDGEGNHQGHDPNSHHESLAVTHGAYRPGVDWEHNHHEPEKEKRNVEHIYAITECTTKPDVQLYLQEPLIGGSLFGSLNLKYTEHLALSAFRETEVLSLPKVLTSKRFPQNLVTLLKPRC